MLLLSYMALLDERICRLVDQIVAVLWSFRQEAQEESKEWRRVFHICNSSFTSGCNPSVEEWEKNQRRKCDCSRSLLRDWEVKRERCEKTYSGLQSTHQGNVTPDTVSRSPGGLQPSLGRGWGDGCKGSPRFCSEQESEHGQSMVN